MRSPVRAHVRTDHPGACAHHAGAKRTHRRVVWEPVPAERGAVVAAPRDTVDEKVAAAVGADVPQRHWAKVSCFRLTTMIAPSPPRPVVSLPARWGSSLSPSRASALTDTTSPYASTRCPPGPSDTHARTQAVPRPPGVLDGEAVACGEDGIALFEPLQPSWQRPNAALPADR